MRTALTIAGSDSGGGAGIQADLKTFQQFGVYGTSVIVALTAQNTRGVRAVHTVPPAMVTDQLAALAEDLPPDAVKTGMLASAALVEQVAEAIVRYRWTTYVCDPVMIATSGDRLLDADAERVMRDRLLPLALLVTPNLDEAALLTGLEVHDPASMDDAGRALLRLGAAAALVKGGHLPGPTLTDVLVTPEGVQVRCAGRDISRRHDAEAAPEFLQPGPGPPPHHERPSGGGAELSELLRQDRPGPAFGAAAAAIPCDPHMHQLRAFRQVHRRRRLAESEPPNRCM